MKEKVQVECPAILGRRQRIMDFRQFIEANRKDKHAPEIIAQYSLETGLSVNVLKRYLKTMKDAKIFRTVKFKIMTPREYERQKS